jgi:hypothetical protein
MRLITYHNGAWRSGVSERSQSMGRGSRTSGSPLTADLSLRRGELAKCAMNGLMQCSKAASLDHLVGAGEQYRRHLDA